MMNYSDINGGMFVAIPTSGNLSVSEIAERSGQRHAGRFSQAYKARYGETPRDTLRRRRFC